MEFSFQDGELDERKNQTSTGKNRNGFTTKVHPKIALDEDIMERIYMEDDK